MTEDEHLSAFDQAGHLRAPAGEIPEICDRSAVALTEAIRRREISVVECAASFLDRIEAVNPAHNAIVSLRPRDAILAESRTLDDRLAAGDETGPLFGLPIAIKDLSSTAGLPTTFGSPIYRDWVPREDSLSAGRIRAAGAIIIGKTNTPEFGLGSHTFNEVFGATGNAFDPRRSAGGSSGGAAVALAARMLPLADGSDMGGSLRNPAAFNNVYGLRPSFGRVPSLPVGNLFEASLATDGPMARSAADLSLLLSVLSGPDARQPLSSGLPGLSPPKIPETSSLRIGWLHDLDGHLPFEQGILETTEACLRGIAGVTLEKAGIRHPEDIWQSFVALRQMEIAGRFGALLDDLSTGDKLKPEMVWEIENGRRLGALDIHRAATMRGKLHLQMIRLFERHDLLALPAAQVWSFPIEWRWPATVAGRAMDSYHRWMECVAIGTLSGCPVLALPAGFRSGLSCGLQIIAPHGREADLLAFARRYERLRE